METLDPTKMTSAQLKKLLDEKQREEKLEKQRKERAYISQRDNFILSAISEMADISGQMKELKERLIKTGNDLHDTMFEIFDKDPKELKKFTLVTEDQKFKLEIQRAETQQLNETAEVAIAQIKEVLQDKFAARNQTMYGMLNEVLMKNNKGDYDPRLVAKLRKWESKVDDIRFSRALDILSAAHYVADSSMYVRGYAKDEKGSYELIPMQFSSL